MAMAAAFRGVARSNRRAPIGIAGAALAILAVALLTRQPGVDVAPAEASLPLRRRSDSGGFFDAHGLPEPERHRVASANRIPHLAGHSQRSARGGGAHPEPHGAPNGSADAAAHSRADTSTHGHATPRPTPSPTPTPTACKPSLSVSPNPVVFGSSATSRSLTISSTSCSGTTPFTIERDRRWLRATPREGTLASGGDVTVEVIVIRSRLSSGLNVGHLTITSGSLSIVVTVEATD